MKLHLLCLLALASICLISCEKDGFLEPSIDTTDPPIHLEYYLQNRKSPPIYSGITPLKNFIHFDDVQTFERAFRQLEREDDFINDRFFDDWGHLPEEKLLEKEMEVGFHEDLAMIYFEQNFGHQSLRKKIELLENQWMQFDELNPETDPNNHFIHDRILKTFFNDQNVIKIGSSIFKVMESGAIYEIKDGDLKTLEQLNAAPVNVPFAASNIVLHHSELLSADKSLFGSCRILAGRRTNWKSYNNGTRRYRGYLGLRNFLFYSGVLSTTTSYRRINGVWKKRRGSLRTLNFGHVTFGSSDCSGQKNQFDSHIKSKYRRHLEKRYVLYFGLPEPTSVARVESGWLNSYHYCNGNDTDFTLLW